jgi:large subunit ribosomal protein L37Ae
MAEKKSGSTKRFGARYGRTAKDNFGKIEHEQRKLHKCPYCSKVAVKRQAPGIWFCRKCSAKFTGKAYTIAKPTAKKEILIEEEES